MRRIKDILRRRIDRLPEPLRRIVASARARLRGKGIFFRLLLLRTRRRLQPGRLSVGWLLSGTPDFGPTRMRGLLPHAYLRTRGVDSIVLAQRLAYFDLRPPDRTRIVRAGFDVVVFETAAAESLQNVAAALRASGTRTVFAVGELRRTPMPEVVDHVVVASESLADLTAGTPAKVSVIESPLESPAGACKDYSVPSPAHPRVVWVGYPENLPQLAPVREALTDPVLDGFELVTISRGPWSTVQWDRRRVWDDLLRCDIAVLPYDQSDWQQTKPNTRLTMLKALGLPIVATPIPSFTATLTHGRGCYFARDVGEWVDSLQALSDPQHRREMGLAERDDVLARYGIESIGAQWLELFEDLRRSSTPALEPATRPD